MEQFYLKYIAAPTGTPQNRIFSPEHFILTGILTIMIILIMHRVFQRDNIQYSRHVLKTVTIIMLCLEIFRICWNWYYHGFSLTIFRFDYCNQICMLLPFFVLFGTPKIYPYVQQLALYGGVIVLIYPLWVFYDYGGIHLMAVQSMTSHALMIVSALTMPMASGVIPNLQMVYKTWIGFFVMCFNAYIMTQVTGVNYLLMAGAKNVPIIQHIPFPWYWLILIPGFMYGTALFSKFWGRWYIKMFHLKRSATYMYSEKRLLDGAVLPELG
ncbi:MAG: hypothetical protein ACOYB8_08005 [Eubacteriaceae bacterium]